MRQAYDYWQDQPGSYSFPMQRTLGPDPFASLLPSNTPPRPTGRLRAARPAEREPKPTPLLPIPTLGTQNPNAPRDPPRPGRDLRVASPPEQQHCEPPISPDRTPDPRFRAQSPSGSGLSKHVHSVHGHLGIRLAQPSTRPPVAHDSEMAAPPLIIKGTSLTVSPSIPLADQSGFTTYVELFQNPERRIIPCTAKTP